MSLGFFELFEQGIVTYSMGSMKLLGTDAAQTKWSALGNTDQDVLFI